MVTMAHPDRLPPVATIRAAMERERAARALAGSALALPIAQDPALPKALMAHLRWPRDGTRRPWAVGISMLGNQLAPWHGVGNVVRTWSSTSYHCLVWRKVPVGDHPTMRKWSHIAVSVQDLAFAIYAGHVTDAYP